MFPARASATDEIQAEKRLLVAPPCKMRPFVFVSENEGGCDVQDEASVLQAKAGLV